MNALKSFILGFLATILLSLTLNAQTHNNSNVYENDDPSSVLFQKNYGIKAEIDDIATRKTAGKRGEIPNVELINYPNPVINQTTISYDLKADAFVALAIYNSNGCLVEQLENAEKAKGNCQVNFNASNLISGSYYCCLIVEGKITTIKILVQ